MIKRVTKLSQVIDSIDDERVQFFHGKSNEQEALTREQIRVLDLTELKDLIKQGLIIQKRR